MMIPRHDNRLLLLLLLPPVPNNNNNGLVAAILVTLPLTARCTTMQGGHASPPHCPST